MGELKAGWLIDPVVQRAQDTLEMELCLLRMRMGMRCLSNSTPTTYGTLDKHARPHGVHTYASYFRLEMILRISQPYILISKSPRLAKF